MYVKCWECGQEIEAHVEQQQLNLAYDQGYKQAIRDMKKIKGVSCATTMRTINKDGYIRK